MRGLGVRLGVLALAALLALPACGGRQEIGSGQLAIATGNTTGVYYQLGGGLATLIDKNLDGQTATAIETSASVDNIKGLVEGKYSVAFSLLDTAGDAVNGKGEFDGKQPIEALMRIYPNYTQVVVRADSGIETLADMKGKAVSTGSPNSGTEVIANRLLESAGLDPAEDVKAQRIALPQTVDAMKDGKIDAMFWSGGLPTSGITDLTTSMKDKVRFLDLSEALPKLRGKYGPVYTADAIPAATYELPGDVPTITVPNVLVVKKGFAPDLAGDLVRLIIEERDALVAINPAAEDITLDNAPASDPVSLNPGAKKALTELARK